MKQTLYIAVCCLVASHAAQAADPVTEDLQGLDCTDAMVPVDPKPVVVEFEGTGSATSEDRDAQRARALALDLAYCNALEKAFQSVGIAKLPYRCNAYLAWRLGEKVLRAGPKAGRKNEVEVRARFRINGAYLKDTITEKALKRGARVALLVAERGLGSKTYAVDGAGDSMLADRLRAALEDRGARVATLQMSSETRAALTRGAPFDLRGPACLARNSGAELLVWARNEREDAGEIIESLHAYQDFVTVTVVHAETMRVLATDRVDSSVACIVPSLNLPTCSTNYQESLVGPLATHALARLVEASQPP